MLELSVYDPRKTPSLFNGLRAVRVPAAARASAGARVAGVRGREICAAARGARMNTRLQDARETRSDNITHGGLSLVKEVIEAPRS